MQKFQRLLKHLAQCPKRVVSALRVLIRMVNPVLRKLDIPVAELIPDKVI